jgi:hypothetical protein
MPYSIYLDIWTKECEIIIETCPKFDTNTQLNILSPKNKRKQNLNLSSNAMKTILDATGI